MSKIGNSLKKAIREVINMAKSLTFLSVILGYILGMFATSTEQVAAVSAWDYSDARYWRFILTLSIAIGFGVWFYIIERRNSDKSDKLVKKQSDNIERLLTSVNSLINEIRKDRNDRRNDYKNNHL